MELTTLSGDTLFVTVSEEDGGITFTPSDCGPTARVLVANFGSCASTLHIIDTVLVPGDGCPTKDEPSYTPEFEIKPAAAVIMDKEVEMPAGESSAYASAVATSSSGGNTYTYTSTSTDGGENLDKVVTAFQTQFGVLDDPMTDGPGANPSIIA
jgi:hypothetical protein